VSPLGREGYLAFMLLAVAAFFLARRLFPPPRSVRLTPLERLTLALAAFVGGTLAAKLPFVWSGEVGFWDWTTWTADGKTITTGLVGAYLSVELTKWLLGIRAKTGDGLAAPLAVALAVGRWGCFVNPCCYGAPTTFQWGVDFGDGVLRHPTQLYESLFHAAWAGILVRLNSQDVLPYQRLKLYLLAYCGFRFAIEFIRVEPKWLGPLTYYQVVVIGFAVFLAVQWVVDARRLRGETVDAERPRDQTVLATPAL
jgi:phosphatidylglycerol---prolipoprotein diacylglyceryl transferase